MNKAEEGVKGSRIIVQFLNYLVTVLNRTKKTVKEYNYTLNQFFRYLEIHLNQSDKEKRLLADFELGWEEAFSNTTIENITCGMLENLTLSDFYSYLMFITNSTKKIKGTDAKPATRATKVACLKSFYRYLHMKEKCIKNNPTAGLESPKREKRIPVHLSLEESKNLLMAPTLERSNHTANPHAKRDEAILTLFLNCGIRLSELEGLNNSSIKDGEMSVIGKGNKERVIPLNDACLEAIEEYKKVRPKPKNKDEKALFLSNRRTRLSFKTIQVLVKKYLKESNLDVDKYSTHKLRHTAATLMYQLGDVDIATLQEILGHQDISTTRIYTHTSKKTIIEAMKKHPLGNIKPGTRERKTR